MDSVALQVVQKTAVPWTRYFTVLGPVGLCAFVGFEGLADAKQASAMSIVVFLILMIYWHEIT